jgi:pilus assembly protein CpaD
MNERLLPLALLLGLAACATDYTKSEAPNNLWINGAEPRAELAFVPGSARLVQPDAIRQLVVSGRIRPSDRVTIAAAGLPALADQRVAAIQRELLAYGIVADALPSAAAPANRAILGIGRYTVTLPPCPDWSRSPDAEYTNAYRSNWGCADAVNLGLMVASPADLVSGRPLAPADGMPASDAVHRYLTDHVRRLLTGAATPFAGATGGGEGGGAPGAAPETGASQQ